MKRHHPAGLWSVTQPLHPKKSTEMYRNVASGSTMVNKSSSYFRGKPWALGEGSLHDVNVGVGSSSSKSRVFFAHSKPWTESFSSSSCLTIFNPTESRINPKTNIHYLDYPHPNQPPTSFDLVFSCFFSCDQLCTTPHSSLQSKF